MCASLPSNSVTIHARCSESAALSKAAQARASCSDFRELFSFALNIAASPSVEEGGEWGDENERTERTGDEA